MMLLPRRFIPRRDASILHFGDSHAAAAGNTSPITWAGILLGGLIDVERYGVGGYTSTMMIASEHLDVIRASNKTNVLISLGTNDIWPSYGFPTVDDPDETKANIVFLVAFCVALGKRPFVSTLPPRSSAQTGITNAAVSRLLDLNAWIRTTFGSAVVDAWADLVDVLPDPIVSGAPDEVWYAPGYAVTSSTVGAAGTGYSAESYLSITHNGGQGAALVPVIVGGQLKGIYVKTRGYGYSVATPPTATLVDPLGTGTGATVTLIPTAGVVGYTITDAGSGYAAPPSITISGQSGLAATAIAEISGGSVSSISAVTPGFNYRGAPAVAISGGATATPIMGNPRMIAAHAASGDTHLGASGARHQGVKLAEKLTGLELKFLRPSYRNLAGAFVGAGGALAAGMSGEVPDDWTWVRTAGTASGIVSSVVDGRHVLSLSPTKSGGATATFVGSLPISGVVPGDSVIAELDIDVVAAHGVTGVSIAVSDGITAKTAFSGGSNGGISGLAFSGPVQTPALLAASDAVTITVTITGSPANSAAGIGFDISLGDIAVRRINF